MRVEDVSTEDLLAIRRGDLKNVSTEALLAYRDGFSQEQGTLEAFGKGMVSGFKRSPAEASGIAESVGQAVGRYGPPAAGAALAGIATGGAALLPAVAATAFGAGAGEAAGQLTSRALGGMAPETSGEAAGAIVKTGLEAAAVDLGLGASFRMAKVVYPQFAQTFLKIPAEAIKRAIKNPELVPMGGTFSRTASEVRGITALRRVQEAINAARTVTGQKVDSALQELGRRTGGKAVVDFSGVSRAGKEGLQEMASADPVVAAALKPDISKISKLIAEVEKAPSVSTSVAIMRRRALDQLVSYGRMGIREVQSDSGERIVKTMIAEAREAINAAAEGVNFGGLKMANKAHSSLMQAVEELGGIFRSRDVGRQALLDRFNRLAGQFNRGGLGTEILESASKSFPAARKAVDELLDAVAAREFTRIPAGTPSGTIKDILRFVVSPANVGRSIRFGSAFAPPARAAAVGIGAAIGSSQQRK